MPARQLLRPLQPLPAAALHRQPARRRRRQQPWPARSRVDSSPGAYFACLTFFPLFQLGWAASFNCSRPVIAYDHSLDLGINYSSAKCLLNLFVCFGSPPSQPCDNFALWRIRLIGGILAMGVCHRRLPLPVRNFVIQVNYKDVWFHGSVMAVHIRCVHMNDLLGR